MGCGRKIQHRAPNVRNHIDPHRGGHSADLYGLGKATTVADIGLGDLHTAWGQQSLESVASLLALASRQWDRYLRM